MKYLMLAMSRIDRVENLFGALTINPQTTKVVKPATFSIDK
jgi:hypothetical protein